MGWPSEKSESQAYELSTYEIAISLMQIFNALGDYFKKNSTGTFNVT